MQMRPHATYLAPDSKEVEMIGARKYRSIRWGAIAGALTLLILILVFAFAADAGASNASNAQQDDRSPMGLVLTDDHLLLCEAVVTPTPNEFIEIANPTDSFVILDDYYLSDDMGYALLPGQFGDGPAPSLFSSDFIAQFPPGSYIAPGSVLVIAFDGAGFETSFGFKADYELHGTDDGTPDMLEPYAGSIGSSAGLTNGGENAVIFYWDGTGDLVEDADMTMIGTPSSSNQIGNKTGVSVDGPDAGITATMYLSDTYTMPQQVADPVANFSTKRISLEVGNELSGGGNGITGDDETTEVITSTWDSEYTAPNPGECAIATGGPSMVINEILADPHFDQPPNNPNGDANGDGSRDGSEDEFIELVNISGAPLVLSGWTISDAVGLRHAFPTGTTVPNNCSIVVFGGGTPTGEFGRSIVQTASTGFLGFNNSGDTVIVNDNLGTAVLTYNYGSEGNDNQSLTRDPDIAGPDPLVKHSTATGSNGVIHSPGTKIDGSNFIGCPLGPQDLGIEKSGPLYVANNQGEDLIYDLTLLNSGTLTATDIVVTDTLPSGVAYVTDSSGVTPTNPSTGVYEWSLPDVPGAMTYTFKITTTIEVTPAAGTVLTNTVVMTTTLPNDEPSNNSDEWYTAAWPMVRIHDIQGAQHLSPYDGSVVLNVPGIVTALRFSGFFFQDPVPDADDKTSEAIYVFTGSSPNVSVGDSILVSGLASEYYPGGFGTGNLSTSQMSNAAVTVLSRGNPLPPATVVGDGGRVPPDMIIDNDSTGDVNTTPNFDPDEDGIDFYESLEAMLLQVNDAVVVGSNRFGEIGVVGDSGAHATFLTPRGGVYIQSDDFNPERILIDDTIFSSEPDVNVGDAFTDIITGVLDYTFGNFKLLNVNALPPITTTGLLRETTSLTGSADQLTVASYNVLNLDPSDSEGGQFEDLADQIVNNLQASDIIGLQEIQDNSGTTDDGTVAADITYGILITEIVAAGGPTYEYRDISPADKMDGGVPGGNIRVGFLFNPSRVTFVDRPGGDATTATTAALGPTGVELSYSPGRIDPTNIAFDDSRKPLAAEFVFNGHKVFVVNGHFNSKSGDDPLFGRVQPPVFPSEIQRSLMATVVNDFVDSIVALDTAAKVFVIGDLNDFQFSTAVGILSSGVLTNMIDTLPTVEQYTYLFDSNSQVLDHILVSYSLFNDASPEVDVVHVNAEFDTGLQASDHDPVVSRVTLDELAAGFTSNSPVILGATGLFSNATTGAAPIAYQWDFGDNTVVVTDTNPSHLYAAVGTYTVVLTATNLSGSDVYTDTFLVQTPTDVVLSGFSVENQWGQWLWITGLITVAVLAGFVLSKKVLSKRRV